MAKINLRLKNLENPLLFGQAKMSHKNFMQTVIEAANQAKKAGEWVGGSIIVKNNEIIATAQNQVKRLNDPTAHSEIMAIRNACRLLSTTSLSGCSLYSNAEPCPMCLAASVWAGIENIYYGVSLKELLKMGDFQFKISSQELIDRAFRKIKIIGGVEAEECRKQF